MNHYYYLTITTSCHYQKLTHSLSVHQVFTMKTHHQLLTQLNPSLTILIPSFSSRTPPPARQLIAQQARDAQEGGTRVLH